MRVVCLLLLFGFHFSSLGQDPGFLQNGDIFGTRGFVENRGQFDSINLEGAPVLYALENGDEKIYFTKKGLIYLLSPEVVLSEAELKDKYCRKEFREKRSQVSRVVMKWERSDPSQVSIAGHQKQGHYITYGGPELDSKVFKKIIFLNVYPGIDIEYVIPDDKPHGIKYNFIVSANSDPKQISIRYSGDVNSVIKNNQGEIVVKTSATDIIEHAPVSYAGSQPVVTSFTMKSDTIGFDFPKGYNKQRTLTIDPWVTSITSFSSFYNFAYDVDYDFVGNTFIYGSYGPVKVAKFDNYGVLQWCFSGNIVNPSWSTQPTEWIGNFVVERSTGKCFIGQGVSSIGSKVVRLDTNGNYDNFISVPNSNFQEIWDMGFHCSNGLVFTLGGGHISNISAATINTLTGALNFSTFQPTINTTQQDIASACIDDQGDVYVVYSTNTTGQINNRLCKVNSSFNGNVWTAPTSFNSLSEAANKIYGGKTLLSNGFNCLAVNSNYLFYYDGRNLGAYSKSSGQQLASLSISFFIAKTMGGIEVDDCDIVYLGGQGKILSYKFSGQSFSPLTPITIANGANFTGSVYDLKFNKIQNKIYFSGQGFCGYTGAVLSGSCFPAPTLCANNFGVSVKCTSITCLASGSASVAVFGPANYTCTWLPMGITGTTAAGLTSGIYTVIVNMSGVAKNFSTTINFSPVVPLTGQVSFTGFLPCATMTGSASIINMEGDVPGKMSYLWAGTNGTYSAPSISGLNTGQFSVTVVNLVTGCSLKDTFSIYSSPPLTLTISVSSQTACADSPIILTGVCAGGAPGSQSYSYKWTNGPGLPAIQISHQPGKYEYSLTARDSYSCSVFASAIVTFVPNPLISIQQAIICPKASATLVASGASNYLWNNGITGNKLVDSPLASTCYTVTGMQAGCTSTTAGTIFVLDAPHDTLVSNSPICENLNLKVFSGKAIQHEWTGPGGFVSNEKDVSIPFANPSHSGVYSVTLTASSGCTNSAALDLTVFPTPVLVVSGDAVCQLQSARLTVNGAANYVWNSQNGFLSTLPEVSLSPQQLVGTEIYTVTGTSVHNCTASAYASVIIYPLPQPTLRSPFYQRVCVDDSVRFSAEGGLLYEWQGPNTILFSGPSVGFAAVAVDYSGTYTLVVRNEKNCSVSLTTNLLVLPLPEGKIIPDSVMHCIPHCTKYHFQSGAFFNDITNTIWKMDSALIESQEITKCFSSSGDHTLMAMVRNVNGCVNTVTFSVRLPNMPVADFGFTPVAPVAQLDEVNFFNSSTAEAPAKYSWHFNLNNEQNLLFKNPAAGIQTVFAYPGNYAVVLVAEDKWGCRDTAIKVVHVKEDIGVFVPNAFTPNGDGLNETFRPILRGYALTNLLIFDRWGEKIFESSSSAREWDGSYAGSECKTDVYTWKLNILSPEGKEEQRSGMVHLLK